MKQQTINSKTQSSSHDSSSQPLSLSQAIGQLPRQYIKVLCKPSTQTFLEEGDGASWGIVFIQLCALIVITVTFSYLAHLIPFSALHTTSAFAIGSFKPFAFLLSPYNGITFVLVSFIIGLSTAYLFSKLWRGQGTFLVHTQSLLLCTLPLVTISGALLLIPATGPLVLLLSSLIFVLFVYRTLLHVLIVMAIHGLSTIKATSIILIIPMCIFIIAMFVLIITSGGEILAAGGDALLSIFEFPASYSKGEKRNKA